MSDERDVFIDIDGREVCIEEAALAELLEADVLGCNAFPYAYKRGEPAVQGPTVTLFVIANDIFAWGCADAVSLPYAEIGPLYKAWKADPEWGVIRWCCRQRNEQPQAPLLRDMKMANAWDAEMEALPVNTSDAACAAQIAAYLAKEPSR